MGRLSVLVSVLAVAAVLAAGTALAAAQDASPAASPVALPPPLDEVAAAWNARDPQRIAALYTDDAVVEEAVLGAPTFRGRAEIAAWAEANFAAIPDLRLEVRSGFVAGDRAAVEWVYAGTYTGQFTGLGLPPGTGQAVAVPYVSVYELADGKIRREAIYFDSALFLSQLGLLAAPVTPAAGTPPP